MITQCNKNLQPLIDYINNCDRLPTEYFLGCLLKALIFSRILLLVFD
ncbi:hypothetical protein NSP_22090 [Nodularia spumigena CCY9414]|nr:hypothetical protein NSP_22090 [Nodularia spumigena CCY9414]